jgi:hypothetical protein
MQAHFKGKKSMLNDKKKKKKNNNGNSCLPIKPVT